MSTSPDVQPQAPVTPAAPVAPKYEAISNKDTNPAVFRAAVEMAVLQEPTDLPSNYKALDPQQQREARGGLSEAEYARRVAVGKSISDGNGQEALQLLANGEGRFTVNDNDAENAVVTVINTDHDATNGERKPKNGSNEEAMADAARERLDAYRTFLNDGVESFIDSSSGSEDLNDQGQKYLGTPVLQALRELGVAEELGIKPGQKEWKDLNAGQKATILKLLKDPYVRIELARKLNAIFSTDSTKEVQDIEGKIADANREVEEAQRELESLESSGKPAKDALKQANNDMLAFNEDDKYSSATTHSNTKRGAYNELTKNGDVQLYLAARKHYEDVLATGNPAIIEAARLELEAAKKKSPEVEEYIKLQDELSQIEDRQTRLKATLNKISEATAKLRKAQETLRLLVSKRDGISVGFSKALERVLIDSTKTVVARRIEDLTTREGFGDIGKKVYDRVSKKAKEEYGAVISGRLNVEGVNMSDRERDREIRRRSQQQVGEFINDPNSYIRGVLKDSGLGEEEIEMLMHNDRWLKDMQYELASSLFKSLYSSGGDLTREQVRLLTRTEWGKHVLMTMAQRNRNGTTAFIQEQYNRGEELTEESFEKARRSLAFLFGNRYFRGTGRRKTNGPSMMVMSLLGMARPEDMARRGRRIFPSIGRGIARVFRISK